MTTSFLGGAFFGGEFFNTATVTPGVSPSIVDGGFATRSAKKRRKVLIGDTLYEVNSLRDVELILKRIVRDEIKPETVTKAAKARIRVVDRVEAKLPQEAPVEAVLPSQEVDWSALWNQLALQDLAYAMELERVLRLQEEDDLEAILLLH